MILQLLHRWQHRSRKLWILLVDILYCDALPCNIWAAMMWLVEAVVARQQDKRVCAGQQHATVGRAVLFAFFRSGVFQSRETIYM
jgi:hypothetical protein